MRPVACDRDGGAFTAGIAAMRHLHRLDQIAREAWNGHYDSAASLARSDRLYVALASGRMWELAPDCSIPNAVLIVGNERMDHMSCVWRSVPQPPF